MAAGPPSTLQLIGMGSTLAGLVAGGMLLGWFIDSQVGTFPIFALIGLLVGMFSAAFQGYSMFRKFTRD